ncbi:Crp/Fnr family transcriptional regulator [uncultured Sunxiuqinia sp.]|uniref:Crp/Fnr family transcriptional regulator n=1 Tax=uncultured Sunxiuqinia sp. TaxID=1573825 RepID=UPI002AA8C023|nr:Crp/Fnr family transcriptional regulator [uncultured Sunxiuqinia sp.]
MNKLLTYIRSLTTFSDESWEKLQPALSKKEFAKNELLLRKNQVCNSLFYIEIGYCKSCYEIDGNKKNTAFYFENEIATNVTSFGSGLKSKYSIIASEPIISIVFNKSKLFEISSQCIEVETLGRICLRQFAAKQEEFSTIFKLYTTQERLEYIESYYPHILQRVPLSQLASFLGVTRETLSRIRKRRIS